MEMMVVGKKERGHRVEVVGVKRVVACLEGERSESEDASTGQVTTGKRRDTVKTIGGPRDPIPWIEPGLLKELDEPWGQKTLSSRMPTREGQKTQKTIPRGKTNHPNEIAHKSDQVGEVDRCTRCLQENLKFGIRHS